MRKGSKPCRLRPVGRIAGVRSRSPPGAGRMKRPSSACRMPAISWSSASRRSVAASSRRRPGRIVRVRPRGPLPASAADEGLDRARSGRAPCAASATAAQSTLLGRSAARRRHAGRAGSACIPAPGAPRPSAAIAAVASPPQAGSAGARSTAVGLRLDQRREVACALAASASRVEAAPALDRGLEVEQAAIEAGLGDRRRQVADQRRAGAALGDRALGRVVGGIEVEVRQVADQPVGPAVRRTGRPACRA